MLFKTLLIKCLIGVGLLFCACGSTGKIIHAKKVQNTLYKEDFDIIVKTIKPNENYTYYWYKSNKVHNSKSDFGGNLLHGEYVKYFITNELAEKGLFKYGLKNGK